MKLSVLDDLLWAASLLSNVVLLIVLLGRARWRRYPIFTCWIVSETGLTIALFALFMRGAVGWYSRVYWTSLWPDFCFQLGVAMELGRAVFRRNGKWVRGARGVFTLTGVGAIVASATLSWMVHPHYGGFNTADLRCDLFTSLVMCALLVAVSLIANWLGLAWSNESLSVARALTVWSAVSLVVNALQSYFGALNFRLINHFQALAWIGAVVWIAMELGISNPDPAFPPPQPAANASRTSRTSPPGTTLSSGRAALLLFRKPFVSPARRLRSNPPAATGGNSVNTVQP